MPTRARLRRRIRRDRGMTLIEIMIVLAIIALVMGLLVGPGILRNFGRAREDSCHAMTRQIESAWVRWKVGGGGDCPSSIDELKVELGRRPSETIVDPWGHPYQLLCGEQAPEACGSGLCVLSLGEDGKPDTEDDIKSWVDRPRR